MIKAKGTFVRASIVLFLALTTVILTITGCFLKPVTYTLTMLEPTGQGEVEPAVGDHQYTEGTVVNLVATPAAGWEFDSWEVDGTFYSDEPATTLTMNADKTVKAFFTEEPPVIYTLTMLEPDGQGAVEPAVGDHQYTEGTVVNLTASPAAGWEFDSWEVDGTFYSDEPATTLTMNADKTVKAFFTEEPPVTYTLTMLEPDGQGEVEPAVGSHQYIEGTVVNLTASPAAGWEFDSWEVDGTFYSDEPATTLTMNADKTVKAFFTEEPPVTYTLTMLEPDGQGEVEPAVGDHQYTEGTVVNLTASPAAGWEFDSWEVDGTFYSDEPVTTLTMDADKTVKAFFKEEPPVIYTLTMLEPDGQGEVEPAVGSHQYIEGTVVNLTASPAAGWEFDRWEVDGTFYSDEPVTTLTMDADKTVKAFFNEEPPVTYTLTMLEPTGQGSVIPTIGTHLYDQGTSVNLLAMPEKGWDFESWFIDGEFYSDNPSTSILINADMTVMAVFVEEVDKVSLYMSRNGQGTVNPPEGGPYEYDLGTVVNISATPASNWRFVEWVVDGMDYSTDKNTTLLMDSDKDVLAVFRCNCGNVKFEHLEER